MANDQKQFWNNRHELASPAHVLANGEVTAFALEVQSVISPQSVMLEIGCGVGNDSLYFASKGHTVVSTDLSEVAIKKNKIRNNADNVTFQVLDISRPTPFEAMKFDVIYARLSLHYFSDKVTKQIFKELSRVLKPGGYLCFLCKSVDDTSYGKGVELEKDMFEDAGHVRHFFSEKYALECLGKDFAVELLQKGEEHFYTRDSAYVKVIAKRV
ncbi:MAG: class I SAM-dependent methyltransferase [Candidatus Levybacteria bacterium]|nr:class I SAM-dependent methyltransferase [Candidatus Levybacteria bacterium]